MSASTYRCLNSLNWRIKCHHLFSILLLFSLSVLSDSLWPHDLQHTRLPCHSPSPGDGSNSCPWSLWCHPSILYSIIPFLSYFQSFLASVFPNKLACIEWPKYWSFSFSISLYNEYSMLISFRIDLISMQFKTFKSLLQHHSSETSILWCSAFFMVHLSHPCMTPGKTIALTIWALVGKVMSLLFNMLSSLVIACLKRSKCF